MIAVVEEDRRQKRHVRRSLARIMRPDGSRRIKHCGRTPTGGGVAMRADMGGAYRVDGLQTCGSPWECAVCAAKIRIRRADILRSGIERWKDKGGEVVLMTLTIPHTRAESLADGLALTSKFWHSVRKTRPIRAASAGLFGYTRSTEVTYSETSGWHPHLHVLLWVEPGNSGEEIAECYVEAWMRACSRRGLSPSREAQDHRLVTDCSIADYVTKGSWDAGAELSRHDVKVGRGASRSPWELLDVASNTGDVSVRGLWREYVTATRGKQSVVSSHDVRSYLSEESDEELAQKDDDMVDQTLEPIEIPKEVWHWLRDDAEILYTIIGVLERDRDAGIELLALLEERPPDREWFQGLAKGVPT